MCPDGWENPLALEKLELVAERKRKESDNDGDVIGDDILPTNRPRATGESGLVFSARTEDSHEVTTKLEQPVNLDIHFTLRGADSE